ncbi:serine hydrolase domain-containing protein [Phytomonospora sp. NPDC050363]|uniref:serine hydrolase domain-containing protein n=1 Tax=Phytomonospora sp. NPDC050363 TaxID=3155642 RepID=UPI0033CDD0CB
MTDSAATIAARLRPAVTEALAASEQPVPAVSVAVLVGGELVTVALGAEPTSRFQACSISKPIAAAVALRLGLDLDSDVNDLLRSWRLPAPADWPAVVTVRHLLSHSGALTTSGFPGYAEGEELPTLVEIVDGEGPANTGAVRVDGIPGTACRYSGGGYQILQLILEDIGGAPFAELAERLVLAPLGMETAGYAPPTDVAVAHVGGKPVEGGWKTYPEQAAAGLWCTPSDLVRFFTALREAAAGAEKAFLPAELATEVLTEVVPGFGLGVQLASDPLGDRFGHGGSNHGYRCAAEASREGNWATSVMTNADEGSFLTFTLLQVIADALGFPRTSAAVKNPEAANEAWLARHSGAYRTELGIELNLEVIDGHLHLKVAGQPALIFGPTGDTVAYAPYAHAELRFDAEGDLAGSVELHQFGGVTRAVRQSLDG